MDSSNKSDNTTSESYDSWTLIDGAGKKHQQGSCSENISHDEESSDGISVISESDASLNGKCVDNDKDSENKKIIIEEGKRIKLHENLKLENDNYESITLPSQIVNNENQSETEESDDETGIEDVTAYQIVHKLNSTEGKKIVKRNSSQTNIGMHQVSNRNWLTFGLLAVALAGILIGNNMRLQHIREFNVEHEKRISELELENTILKNEMQKLKQVVKPKIVKDPEVLDELVIDETPPPSPTPLRKPGHEDIVKRKIVWSGDEDEPLFIIDKDYILPEFCYNPTAPKDELYPEEQVERFCEAKKRKIDYKKKKYDGKMAKEPIIEVNPPPISIVEEQIKRNQKKNSPDIAIAPELIEKYEEKFDVLKDETNTILEAIGNFFVPNENDPSEILKNTDQKSDDVFEANQEHTKLPSEAFRRKDQQEPNYYQAHHKNYERDQDNFKWKEHKKPKEVRFDINSEPKEQRKNYNYKDKRDQIDTNPKKDYKRQNENFEQNSDYKNSEKQGKNNEKDLKRNDIEKQSRSSENDKRHKKDDWSERRMKGRENYRGNEQKHSGEWQEKMKYGREEARKRYPDEEKDWYSSRKENREKEREKHHKKY